MSSIVSIAKHAGAFTPGMASAILEGLRGGQRNLFERRSTIWLVSGGLSASNRETKSTVLCTANELFFDCSERHPNLSNSPGFQDVAFQS